MTGARTMTGDVAPDLELLLAVTVRGASGIEGEVSAVIDTGFSGAMLLPKDVVDRLFMEPGRFVSGSLADGSTTIVPVYLGHVRWFDEDREIEIVAAGQTTLIGVQLLEGYRLIADFEPAGLCQIRER
ncbi:MAG: hypothetical protein SH850_02240 [Planctomycetaceae bacterium]|nr:hypothetical protein [Planctomycetaceae bacterium]